MRIALMIMVFLWAYDQINISNDQSSKRDHSPANGEKYIGSFKNGLRNGHGTWIHPTGDKYVGKFKDGIKRGKGTFIFANGEKYIGEFKRDKIHGFGTYYHKNGEKYIGEFKDNKRHGQGYITIHKVIVKSGEWYNGSLIETKPIDDVKAYLNGQDRQYPKEEFPPELSIDISFREPSGDRFLETGEKGVITLSIANKGGGSAFGLEVFIDHKNSIKGIKIDDCEKVQELEPDSIVTITTHISALEDLLLSGTVQFEVNITEYNGYDLYPPGMFFIRTKVLSHPELVIIDLKINDLKNNNGLIEPAEIIEAKVIIKNRGQRSAKNVSVSVLYGENIFNTGKSSFSLGDIHHNEIKDVTFSFFAMINADRDLPIMLEIKENSGKYDQLIPAGLALNKLINNPN